MPYLVLIIVLLTVSVLGLVLYARRSRNFTIRPRTTSTSGLLKPSTSWDELEQAMNNDNPTRKRSNNDQSD